LLGELPAGEAIAVGFVPEGKPGAQAWLKLKVLDLGTGFNLPLCKGKLSLDGPAGNLDTVTYSLCEAPGLPEPQVWGLDPAYTDECKNDDLATWCEAMLGGETIGTPGKQNPACDLDGDGYSTAQGDCDDQNKNVHPGSIEVCNGLDDDCDGSTDNNVAAPAGVCLSLGVCAGPLADGSPVAKCGGKGGWACSYPFGYESAAETLCDGFDNDCDGKTDEGLLQACGQCGPAPVETCNGLDDDCNGKTDDGVQLPAGTCSGAGVCAQGEAVCKSGIPMCALPPTHESTETLCDGLDNDCDGQTDEELGLGYVCSVGVGACAGTGIKRCGAGGAVVCDGQPGKSGTELCGDGLDNNCDGKTDEGFAVGEQCAAGQGICRVVGKRVCSADQSTAVCNVQPAKAESSEKCGNGLDDDCDGVTDEPACTGGAAQTTCSAGRQGRGWPWLWLLMASVGGIGWRGRRRWG
jgi:hypothetical protein